MRRHLPILIACLMIFSALLVTGCGDDEASTTPAQESTTAATSASGATGGSAQIDLDSCLEAAGRIPSETASAKAKQQCQEAYDRIKEQSKKIDESVSEARDNCKQAAESLPDGQAKEDALAACEKFQ